MRHRAPPQKQPPLMTREPDDSPLRAVTAGVTSDQKDGIDNAKRIREEGGSEMATNTPPPYFPQGSLAPADEGRYKKFKLFAGGLIVMLLLLFGGLVVGLVYLVKWLS